MYDTAPPLGYRTDYIIDLRAVSVHYRVPKGRRRSFKQFILHFGQIGQPYEDIWALRDIDLSVAPGEVMGVIGRNGAGKSTLLSVISRVLKPESGTVTVCGRIAPLLALGAGFDPELSGQENVFLNGALLGFSKRTVADRFDSIVDFAELQDFIDAPLKTYSSGMMTRLGFSIATSIEADILLVDEVLAVGDENFRKKCENRIRTFREQNMTIFMVSHDLDTVRDMCTRVIWLEKGHIEANGEPKTVIAQYRAFMAQR
jgi:ABC-type polysaccharide/polyol phosphate transport system ATPase subunit